MVVSRTVLLLIWLVSDCRCIPLFVGAYPGSVVGALNSRVMFSSRLLFELTIIADGAGASRAYVSMLYLASPAGAVMFSVVFAIMLLFAFMIIACIASSLFMVICVLFMMFPSESSMIALLLFSNISPFMVTFALFWVIIWPLWNIAVPSLFNVTSTSSNMNLVFVLNSPLNVRSQFE